MTPDEAARHLAALVASSDDAIISKDLDGIVRTWNTAAERIFGFTAQEMEGRSIRVTVPDDRQGEEDAVLARIRRGERVQHFETVRRRRDGCDIAVSLTVSPICAADGTIVGASSIARDITVIQQSAARERDLRRRLEMLVTASATALTTPEVDAILPAVLK